MQPHQPVTRHWVGHECMLEYLPRNSCALDAEKQVLSGSKSLAQAQRLRVWVDYKPVPFSALLLAVVLSGPKFPEGRSKLGGRSHLQC